MFEPWQHNSIVEARNWWDLYLMPEIRKLITILNTRSHAAWKTLAAMSPNHQDFKQIRVAQRDVRDMWYKRPRWKDERGMVEEKGY